MEIYETRELVKILLEMDKKDGLHAKSLQEKHEFFTNAYRAELVKQKYVQLGYKVNNKFTTKTDSTGYDSETMYLGIAEHGKYVIDQHRKERNAIIREVVLCFLSALVGALFTLLVSL